MIDYKLVYDVMEGCDGFVYFVGNFELDFNYWDFVEWFNNNMVVLFNVFNVV